MDIQKIGGQLLEAEKTKQTMAPLRETYPEMTVAEAYEIQLETTRQKVAGGGTIVGKKIGATSRAIQEMFDSYEPDYGHLTDDMFYSDGDSVSLERFIDPKIEFEIAFILNKDLKGPNVSIVDVMNAIEYVVPAIEIIDSRIENWNIKFVDTVADNGSAAAFVIGGKPTKLDNLDLPHLGMVVYKNGEFFTSAAGAAVLGNPLRSVAWLANAIGKFGVTLKAGEVILAGALTAAVSVEAGDVFKVEFADIGSVSMKVST